MAKFACLAEMKARSGRESELEAFLNKQATVVQQEPCTLLWHAAKDKAEPKTAT